MSERRVGLSVDESSWPEPPPPYPADAPNVLVLVLDDTGFGQLGCYGSDIDTPNLDRLAARGVRFTNFHTTAVCSPTRACLLTGRNHHRVGMGFLPDLPMRFPAYSGRRPPEAGTLAEILRDEGWATYCVGKWHLTPRDERSRSGPYGTWPLGSGFERFYGFLAGDANHWAPELVQDNTSVDPPRTPDEGYHLTEDLAEKAIGYIRELRRHQPERPFLCWLGLGATHAPHHVAPEWADRYAGSFDAGWDEWRERTLARQEELGIVPPGTELSTRPDHVTPWSDLSDDERRVYARMMEVYAGFLTHTDHQVGRVLDALEDLGELDDTVVVVVSDNGASGEGGPHGSVSEYRFMYGLGEDLQLNLDRIDDLGGVHTYNHYPWAWAWAGNTPLRRFKRYTFEGGVRDPMIVSWPAGTPEPGSIRDQYCHAVDVLPTILDCVGVDAPQRLGGVEQMAIDGVTLRPVLADAEAAEPRTTQYYECWGSRAIYQDGWKAVTDHVNQVMASERELIAGSHDFHADEWALYDTRRDFGENHDLAGTHPDRLRRLVDLWYTEAGRNGVLPLDDGVFSRFEHLLVPWQTGSTRAELAPGERLSEEACPSMANGCRITAELAEPLDDAEGVLAEQGDYNNGWVWYVRDGEAVLAYNYVGEAVHRITARLRPDLRSLAVVARPDAGGLGCTWWADGRLLEEGRLPVPFPLLWSPNSSASLLVGAARPLPVCDDYVPPFSFTGSLARVLIETDGTVALDPAEHTETVRRHQ